VIFFSEIDGGPLVAYLDGEVSTGATIFLVGKCPGDDETIQRIKDRLSKHEIGATVYQNTPESILEIRKIIEEEWGAHAKLHEQ
jgi:hypothetical protein